VVITGLKKNCRLSAVINQEINLKSQLPLRLLLGATSFITGKKPVSIGVTYLSQAKKLPKELRTTTNTYAIRLLAVTQMNPDIQSLPTSTTGSKGTYANTAAY